MDNIDRMMQEADRLGFGVSCGKYQAACRDGRVKSVSAPPKPRLPEKPAIPCRHCGNPFVRNHANQVYCSPECKYAAQQAKQAASYKKAAGKKKQLILVCVECGADFKALRSSQKYCCKECAKDGNRKVQARWWAAHKKGATDGSSL